MKAGIHRWLAVFFIFLCRIFFRLGFFRIGRSLFFCRRRALLFNRRFAFLFSRRYAFLFSRRYAFLYRLGGL